MKKTISNRLITLMMLILSVFSSAKVNAANEWTVNPANYRYDMSLYFDVAFAKDKIPVDLENYEVAAFVDSECRGIAEGINGVGNCLYMRIRSNSESGEEISFKIKEKNTGEITEIEKVSIPFEANKAIGIPSSPYNISIVKYFDVSFSASDGGSVSLENGRYAEDTVLEVSAIPDEHYSFAGWNDGVTDPTRSITVTDNISLEATFKLNSHTLSYVLEGETYDSVTLEYGAEIVPVSAPEKEGYTFSGWQDLPATMPDNDVTVSGSYIINSYKLTYVVDGEEYKSSEVNFGEKITPEEAPVKEGYTFSGWDNIPETMPAKDVTVSGSFAANTYKLTYVVDGKEYKSSEVNFGEKINPEEAPVKEGYTFSGWDNIPETMPAKDVTVSGSFTVNAYKLTYVVDGKEYKVYEVNFGEKITPEEAPVKEGYTFSGWDNVPETMPAKDVTVSGSFTVNAYKLTYVVDGKEYNSSEVNFGEKINPEEAPVKEGYTFSGWENLPETMPANDVTVSGSFTVNAYKLTYVVDGKEYNSVEINFGEKITPEEAPVKEGYTFSGWENVPETMPANDVTVSGSFTVNAYKLTYVVDGKEYNSVEINFGEKINPEEAPVKEGYTFSGWDNVPETMPAKDVTVSGSFAVNTYKLTYVVDGQEYKVYEVKFGEKINPEEAPVKEGYTFSGWENIPETMPAKDVTVSGSFVVNAYKLTYVVDGQEHKVYEVKFGEKINPEEAPVKEGYTFSGWENVPETMPAKDVTVTGSFAVNTYKLTYVVDGQEYKVYEVKFGEKINPEEAPVKEGYTFSGWENIPETMPAKDVTVSGSFVVNAYKLTYVVDGQEYKVYEVKYGEKINPEEAPVKEGYTFSGWENIPETMPAKDVTVTGSFAVNTYKLTYVVDGKEYKSVDVKFGEKINPEEAPVKEGYTFSGWENLPETMPAKDVTVTGSFTVNAYKLTYVVDGKEYKSVDVKFGEKINPEEAPVKEGYTFIEWEDLPETMPAYDVTAVASYSQNMYKLTVYLDGEVYLELELAMGDVITIPDPEVPAGSKFNGWDKEIPDTMPAYDLEIHGTTSDTSGLTSIFSDPEAKLTVYSINGRLLLRNVSVSEAKEKLSKGMYIINGKKVILK